MFTDKRKGWVPERLMHFLGMEGLLEQMKDHARIHSHKINFFKNTKNGATSETDRIRHILQGRAQAIYYHLF